jgi:hypothetical protein
MYPDRATFQRMVANETSISGPGKETLFALYDGPLRLRQILDIINAPGRGADPGGQEEREITESALRKRLEILIGRGIIARAGSERINPYYYIRRPWIFNQYILVKCLAGPSKELQDLTILIHVSHMADETSAALPPRNTSLQSVKGPRGATRSRHPTRRSGTCLATGARSGTI